MPKKRKSKMTMDLSNNQSITGATFLVAPVALLIDGENVIAPDLILGISIETAQSWFSVNVRKEEAFLYNETVP